MGIDCGSFFTKSSISTPFNIPTVGLFHQSKRAIPSFLAFRAKPSFNLNEKASLTEGESELLSPEFGERALTVMDFRPWMGSGYFSFLAGTDNNRLNKKLHVNMTASRVKYNDLIPLFLNCYMKGVYGSNFTKISEVSLVFPATATIDQRMIFERALESLGIFNYSSIDDIDAVCYTYALEKISKFTKKPNKVLFIDIGATSVKSYVAQFELSHKKPVATRLSYSIHYEVGGAYITNAIVDSMIAKINLGRDITVAERQRLFTAAEKIKLQLTLLSQASVIVENIDGRDFEYKMERKELEELKALSKDLANAIKEVVEKATDKLDFNEIEVIGGSSRIPFVQAHLQSVISNLTNHGKTVIGHSLNADESIALGAGYYSQYRQNQSQYQPVKIVDKYPIYTITIKEISENRLRTEHYVCHRGIKCNKNLTIDGNTTRIEFYIDQTQLPVGISKKSLYYETEAIAGTSLFIQFENSPTRIKSIERCSKPNHNGECKPFDWYNISNSQRISKELVHLFVDANAREEHIAKTRHEIEELATRVLNEVEKNATVRYFTNYSQRIDIIHVAEAMKKWSTSPEAASCQNLLNFTTRLSKLKRAIGPVYVRIMENATFYDAAQELQMTMGFMGQFAEQIGVQAPNMDRNVINKFRGKIASTKTWLADALKKNQMTPPYKPIPIKARQFNERKLELKEMFDKVMDEAQRTPKDQNFLRNREKFLKMEEEKAIKKLKKKQKEMENGQIDENNDEI